MRLMKGTAVSFPLFAVCMVLAACGGGGGSDDDGSADVEDLQPYATFSGYGPLVLHIVNHTSAAVTNVKVLFTLPDGAYDGSSLIEVDCPSATFLPAAYSGASDSPNDFVLAVSSMTSDADCSAKVPVVAVGTVRVAEGGATADGGLTNLQAYEFTYKAP